MTDKQKWLAASIEERLNWKYPDPNTKSKQQKRLEPKDASGYSDDFEFIVIQ